MDQQTESKLPPDQIDGLIAVLQRIRSGADDTRPGLALSSGLGRTVISQRVSQLIDRGLIEDGELGTSTGGRAPRRLRFVFNAGHILVAFCGATSVDVAVVDLSGTVVHEREEPWDIAVGPEKTLDRLTDLFTDLLREMPARETAIWGIGVGLPGPVEFASGRPIAPPIMPGWDGFPVREHLSARFDVPVWVDNEVNLMALGELRAGDWPTAYDLVYVKVGTGIGAGLITGGRLHRGAQGCAGDLGHVAVPGESKVCRCGNVGCLEAVASGAALERECRLAAEDGRSRYLADLLADEIPMTAAQVVRAAEHGDAASVQMLQRCGVLIGEVLATVVNCFNPSSIIVGGGLAHAGDRLLAPMREAVYRRSLPLATRHLRIVRSSLEDTAGVVGAAFMVIDELFSPKSSSSGSTTDHRSAVRSWAPRRKFRASWRPR